MVGLNASVLQVNIFLLIYYRCDFLFNGYFFRNETTELKEQLYSSRLQKASLEETLFNSEQELAKQVLQFFWLLIFFNVLSFRWRFEALKSRCILINRETILEENKIPFPAVVTPKILTPIEIQKEEPDILSFIETSPTNQNEQSVLMESSKESVPDCSPPPQKRIKLEEVDSIKHEIEEENEENDSNIPNIAETKMEVEEVKTESSSPPITPTTSILSDPNERDFGEKKNVKFSESTLDFSESNTEEMKERAKLNRAKSCVVVKRLVVKSRLPTKTNL